MVKIFISYRRVDSQERAQRIADWMTKEYGDENVFFDVEDIPGGDDFADVLNKNLKATDILLVVIGEKWSSEFARRMSFDETDYVRLEVATGLKFIPLVIPLTMEKTIFPNEDELPEDVLPIVKKNFMTARGGADFATDMNRVKERIDKYAVDTGKVKKQSQGGSMSWLNDNAQAIGALVGIIGTIATIIFGVLALRPAPTSTATYTATKNPTDRPTDMPTETDSPSIADDPTDVPATATTNTSAQTVSTIMPTPTNAPTQIPSDTPIPPTPLPTIPPTTAPTPYVGSLNITLSRNYDSLGFCTQETVTLASVLFRFESNYTVNTTNTFEKITVGSNACLCIQQDSASPTADNCSATYTINGNIPDAPWRNSAIEVRVNDTSVGMCQPQPDNRDTFFCRFNIQLGE